MKSFVVDGSFGIDNLKLIDRPDPIPREGEILLRVRAVSLNYRDLLVVKGFYDPKQVLPFIPCSDGAGEVVAVGPGVEKFRPGDRVMPIFSQRWWGGEPTREKLRSTLGSPLDGTLTQLMIVSEGGAVKIPENLNYTEAAALPCAALTAWSALVELAELKPGQTVLLQGTGGVSIFALQFAKAMGAEVIITSSSDEKLKRAEKLGADHLINYRKKPNWGKVAKELTGGRGVDLVVEVGGAETLKQSLKAVKVGGQIALIGVLSGVQSELNILPILMQQVRIQGVLVGHREGFEAMNRAIEIHKLSPVIDRVFSFEEAPEAFRYMESGAHFGKICIEID